MTIPEERAVELVFVTAVSNVDVFAERLWQSPCLRSGRQELIAYFNVSSAAQAFNRTMSGLAQRASTWLVWVHQDVFLPADWDQRFIAALQDAQRKIAGLAVAGVYGVAGAGAISRRAGHVLDRGNLLREAADLPCVVDSLDELLFAVRADTQLALDGSLGFDFYATDLVLQAQSRGWSAAAVDAYCEHWSGTPSSGPIPTSVTDRVIRNGRAFETKWAHRFPISTSWVTLESPGDTERFVAMLSAAA